MSSADDEVRDQLLAHGDDGKKPRHTLFYFYDGDLDALGELARGAGFEISHMVENRGLILEKTLPVDEASFAPVAAMMDAWSLASGAEYDGWECELLEVH